MNTKKHLLHRLPPLAAFFFTVMTFSAALHAQQTESATPTGAPEDWTHHHLIFSNPGSAEDALRNGNLDDWYKITADPRYKIQQLKRGARRPASATASELALRTPLTGIARPVPIPVSVKRPMGTLKRDWSMSYGGGSTATLTAVVGSTINSTSLPSGASFTIDGQTFASNDPTSSSRTLTVSVLPASTSATVTVTNGSNNFKLTENGTAASTTGNFVTLPTATASTLATMSLGANTITLDTTATAASFPLTLDSGGETSSGTITYTYSGGASNVTIAISPAFIFGGSCSGSAGAYTGTFTESSTTTNAAANFLTALNACLTAAGLTSSFTAARSSATVTLTDVYLGNFLSVSNTLNRTSGTITTGSNGTASCTNVGTTYTVDYVSSNSTSTLASNLHSALAGCAAGADVSLTYTSGASLGIAASVLGTGSFTTSNSSVFTFTSTNTGGNGSNACTSSTAGTFGTGSTVAAVATALQSAINACSSGVQTTTGINALATTNGSGGVTVFALTPGTTGGAGISLPTPGGGFATWGATTLSGGTDGSNSATAFAYWSGSTYVSQSQLATNVAAALSLNSTITTDFTIGAANSPATGDIFLTANTGGTAGNSYTLTPISFTALTAGSFSGGRNGVAADMGAEIFPAKYSFNGPPSCSDFVAYTTGVTGGTSGPTLIAYNNIYEGASPSCGTVGVPTVYWQFNTAYPSGGGSTDSSYINTSPVLSGNGAQLAFIQTTGSAASLVILKWASNSSLVQMNSAANNVTPANYPTCTAPCMTRIAFNTPANDTISSPFYDYGTDIIYVGDAAGKLHQFTHVFNGTGSGSSYPTEVLSGGWPVTVNGGNALTSPVYDPVSGLVFVANKGTAGYLYSVNSAGAKVQSYQLAVSPGIAEGPVVDSTSEEVYVYVPVDTNNTTGLSCANASGCNGVYQLPATFTATTSWNESVMGVGTTEPVYTGGFDNQYYTSENSNPTKPTGNLYVCGTYGGTINEPKLMDATIASGVFTPESGSTAKASSDGHGEVYFATNVAKPMTSAAAACSPVTENFDGASDWIFMSVTNSGSLTATTTATCTGACVYSWNTTSTLTFEGTGTTVTQPTQGLAAAGGTGGIIIDNSSSQAGASQIYFGTLGVQTCTGNGVGPGTGSTGGCAVQASQNGLD